MITVTGNNEKDVEEAIEEIMIERIAIPIENQIIEYVCGQNDKNLSFFHDRSGVLQLNIESQANGNFALVAAGTKRALDDLTTIVQTHIGLYEPYQEKNLTQTRKVFYAQPPTVTQQPAT